MESEEWLQEEAGRFFLKQGRILLAEAFIIFTVWIVLIAGTVLLPKDIVLKRNRFGEGTKEVEISLKDKQKQKKLIYKLGEQELSDKQVQKVYKKFFKELQSRMAKRNSGLDRVTTSLDLPERIKGYPFEITYELPEDGYIRIDGTLNE